jgi:hypothetical protein
LNSQLLPTCLVLCSTFVVVGTQGQITDSWRCLWCWRKTKRAEERWMLVSELDTDEAVHASCVVVFRITLPCNAHIQKYHHGNTATAGCFSFRFLILIRNTFLRESSRETAAGILERGRNLDLWELLLTVTALVDTVERFAFDPQTICARSRASLEISSF